MTFWLLVLVLILLHSYFFCLRVTFIKKSKNKAEFLVFKSRMWRKNVDTEKFAYIFAVSGHFFAGNCDTAIYHL